MTPAAGDREPRATGAEAYTRPRVLLVDDEGGVRHVIAMMLRRSGFEVIEAPDGVEALASIRQAPVDLVLTDLNMPRCDGEQLCAELKRDPMTAGIPVVLMTGGVADEERMRHLGCVDVLHKPLSPAVAERIRAIVEPPVSEPGADPEGTGGALSSLMGGFLL